MNNEMNKEGRNKAPKKKLLTFDKNQLSKDLREQKKQIEKLEAEIKSLKSFRWLRPDSGAGQASCVIHEAWINLVSRDFSEIVQASDLVRILWDKNTAGSFFSENRKEREEGEEGELDNKVIDLIELFVYCQWMIALAESQKYDLFRKVSRVDKGSFSGGFKQLDFKGEETVRFAGGVSFIVSDDLGFKFGNEKDSRFPFFPKPDPMDAPDFRVELIKESELTSVESDSFSRKRNIFWRFFWYQYCEEVFHSWKYNRFERPFVVLDRALTALNVDRIPEVGFENIEHYTKFFVANLFSNLEEVGFSSAQFRHWQLYFAEWRAIQLSLQNSKARSK
jgi:hypothetical protein